MVGLRKRNDGIKKLVLSIFFKGKKIANRYMSDKINAAIEEIFVRENYTNIAIAYNFYI